ncbi:hypothetical protein [Colwellia sp. MEBiC06753]
MLQIKSLIKCTVLCALACASIQANAIQKDNKKGFEITPYLGYMIGSDIAEADGSDIELSKDAHYGLAFSWQDSPSGQGQILVNYVAHDFDSATTQSNEELKVLYAHFSGVAQFRERNYITTFSIGLGGAYMDGGDNTEIYPSATAALGTRYEFSPSFSVFTELRAYATLTDEDDDLFCKNDVCAAQFDNALYFDTSLSVGLAFSF